MIVLPLSLEIQFSLIMPKAMSQSTLEVPWIYLWVYNKLAFSFIDIILELPNIFFIGCGEPTMAILHPVPKLSFIMLELIHKEPIFREFTMIDYSNVDAFRSSFSFSKRYFLIESNLLSIKIFGCPSSKS